MKKLQILALKHVKQLAEQVDRDAISLSNTLVLKKEEFSAEKHTYPLSAKGSMIAMWIEAILENENN